LILNESKIEFYKTQRGYKGSYQDITEVEKWALKNQENLVSNVDITSFANFMTVLGNNVIILFNENDHPSIQYKGLALEFRFGNPSVNKSILVGISSCKELAQKIGVKIFPALIALNKKDNSNHIKGTSFNGDLNDFEEVRGFISEHANDPREIYKKLEKEVEQKKDEKK